MKARLMVLTVVLGVLAIQLSRGSGRAVAPVPREVPHPVLGSTRPARPLAAPVTPAGRDPFRFVDVEALARPRPVLAAAAVYPSPEPAPARARLVGLVRRGGTLQAALVVDGAMVLAAAGDRVSGFLVLSLDEEGGVRVRDPQGLVTTLALPEEP